MDAIPIPDLQPDEEQLLGTRKHPGVIQVVSSDASVRRPSVIPKYQVQSDPSAPSITVPDSGQVRSIVDTTGAQGQGVRPITLSNQGKPIVPQTPGRAIPINRATGAPEELNNQGKPIVPGIAGLWARADNIHNPFLRALGKIGAVGARAIDVAGSVAAPGVMAQIPGTALNQKVEEASAAKHEKQDTDNAATQARTAYEQAETNTGIPARAEYEKAQADALKNPQPKPKEEQWEVMTGFQGPNGEPILIEKNSGQQKLATAVPGAKKAEKPDTATQEDQKYEDIRVRKQLNDPNKPVTPEEEAWAAAYEKRKTLGPFASAVAQAPERGEQRSDRSYQQQSSRLERARQPIDEAVRRLGRLQDTLSQQNPQADALIAPELLTVMAGGQGSGLRMNEAEISRIVGGRSAWENLKGSLQHWSTNPNDARSITPEQDKQIRALVETVNRKLLAKQQIINKAEDELVDTDDPHEHRRIVNEAQRGLDAVDNDGELGANTNEPPRPANVPAGYVFKENGPKGRGWYKP